MENSTRIIDALIPKKKGIYYNHIRIKAKPKGLSPIRYRTQAF
ncbi:IS3 family transposase [Caenibacillus caldisaponilyticus]